jgi:hypothetical protein
MYGEPTDQRDDRPATPLGVSIIVILLLICGLALAALPLTVYLLGNRDDATGRVPEKDPSALQAPQSARPRVL